MIENSLYDKKSLLTITSKKIDWKEIVKDVVEISDKRYKTQIVNLEKEGIIGRRGTNRWTIYYLISTPKSR